MEVKNEVKVVDENTFYCESGLIAEEEVEYFDYESEDEKEEIIRELEENIDEVNDELCEVAEKLTEKFKGWIIVKEDWGEKDGWVWWHEWELRDPKTNRKAVVFQGIDVDNKKNRYYCQCDYGIYDEKGNLIEEEKF